MSIVRASSLTLALSALVLVNGCAVASDESDAPVQTDDAEEVGEASQAATGVIPLPVPFVNKLIGKRIYIVARHSTKCLEVPGGNYASGQNIQQSTCNGLTQQEFVVRAIPPLPGRNTTGSVIQPSAAGSLCVDMEWGTTQGGERAQVYTCHYGDNQAFTFLGAQNAIKPRNANLCLDVVGAATADGTEIQQSGCHDGWNQDWLYWDIAAGAYIN